VFFGTFIGSLVGVCITKLFLLLPQERFDELAWLAAALACATTIVLMQITKTAHPPAGTNISWPFCLPDHD
jgi:CBS-domain-containing membrane protein